MITNFNQYGLVQWYDSGSLSDRVGGGGGGGGEESLRKWKLNQVWGLIKDSWSPYNNDLTGQPDIVTCT